MTSKEFNRLLRWLDPDPERAGEQYSILQEKLTLYFRKHGCSSPEEQADTTLDRVARRLSDGEVIRNKAPMAYCLGVAKHVRQEYWKRPERKNEPLENMQLQHDRDDGKFGMEERLEKEQLFDCMDHCLERLTPEKRVLISKYYQEDWKSQAGERERMAERLGLKSVGVRTRAHRIRKKLQNCVKHCMEQGKR